VPQEKLPRVVDPAKIRPGGEFFSLCSDLWLSLMWGIACLWLFKPSAPTSCLYMQPSVFSV
jgi:hypothetical protein